MHIIGTGKRSTVVPRPCSQPGFTEPTPLDVAGALLPHLCTLTCEAEVSARSALTSKLPSAVCFCGTILTVTRTGSYPASLIFREPGLSSSIMPAIACPYSSGPPFYKTMAVCHQIVKGSVSYSCTDGQRMGINSLISDSLGQSSNRYSCSNLLGDRHQGFRRG